MNEKADALARNTTRCSDLTVSQEPQSVLLARCQYVSEQVNHVSMSAHRLKGAVQPYETARAGAHLSMHLCDPLT